FFLEYPDSEASKSFTKIAQRIIEIVEASAEANK
ncbi:MAG: Mrp/NBP35 family ATP-binding protein, partial [Crenarchaeota archaeon]|nr:Mrp/NBP35 family ATP-binding protein [Thermoproteota archaeon]